MNKVLFGIAIILAGTAVGFGQKDTGRDKTATTKPEKQVILTSGTTFDAKLENTLDAKKARVGDRVALKTTKSIRQNGEVLVPKGSTLIGRVTDVQRRTKQNSTSRLGMIFDRIEGRNLSVPITASIVSITNTAARTSVGDALESDLATSSQTSASRGSSSSGGGGLLGGVTNTAGGLLNTTTQTADSVTGTAAATTAGTGRVLGRTLDGIQISTAASGSVGSSTTLSSASREVRIEKGATFNFRVDGNGSLQE